MGEGSIPSDTIRSSSVTGTWHPEEVRYQVRFLTRPSRSVDSAGRMLGGHLSGSGFNSRPDRHQLDVAQR